MRFNWEDSKKIIKKFNVRKIKKDQLIILFLAGILMLVISMPDKKDSGLFNGSGKKDTGKSGESDMRDDYYQGQDYVRLMEKELTQILSQIEGCGQVSVMITLKESSEKVVEKDVETSNESVSETDSQGGTRITRNQRTGETTLYGNVSGDGIDSVNRESDGERIPYIRKERLPKAEGVVVVAEGGDNAVVIRNMTEIVQALFGIDTHKIRVVKKNEMCNVR